MEFFDPRFRKGDTKQPGSANADISTVSGTPDGLISGLSADQEKNLHKNLGSAKRRHNKNCPSEDGIA